MTKSSTHALNDTHRKSAQKVAAGKARLTNGKAAPKVAVGEPRNRMRIDLTVGQRRDAGIDEGDTPLYGLAAAAPLRAEGDGQQHDCEEREKTSHEFLR